MKKSELFFNWSIALLILAFLAFIQSIRDGVLYPIVWGISCIVFLVASLICGQIQSQRKYEEESRIIEIRGKPFTVRQLKKMIESPEEHMFEEWLEAVNK